MADDGASSESNDEFDFEEQLRLEKLEKERLIASATADKAPTYTDADGAVFEWDAERNAWFPKVDEDFMARYQMNYGVAYDYDKMASSSNAASTSGSTEQSTATRASQEQGADKRKRKKDKTATTQAPSTSTNTWFEITEDKNTSVYVSNLPSDFTEEELIELMQKCGLILHDPFNKKPKVKLYRNEDGSLKGDGRCCYIKVESVTLALQILDGWPLRDNKEMRVERAKFELKGKEFNPSKRARKLTNKEKRAVKERQEKLFDWRPEKLEIQRSRSERVAILKYMFSPDEFDKDPDFFNDLNDDVKEEATKAGQVKRIVICDRNQDGVVMVYYKTAEEADKCISAMNGRWYGGRRVESFSWDGKTKYLIEETEEERAKRLEQWYNFLEEPNKGDDGDDDDKEEPSSSAAAPQRDSSTADANESSNGNGMVRLKRLAATNQKQSNDLSDNSDNEAAFASTDEEDNTAKENE